MMGWRVEELENKMNDLSNSQKDLIEKEVYQEMLKDYSQKETPQKRVSKAQFKRAVIQFDFTSYQQELSLLLYIGQLLSSIDLEIPTPKLVRYPETDVINLAKTYMRRKEPNNFPYFRKMTNCQEKIQFCYLAPWTSFLGKTYFFNKYNYYVMINSVNGVQDTVTLLHESSHVENYLKYGINLSKYYAELSSITREHYSFDMLEKYDQKGEVDKQRVLSLNHYIARIMRLFNALNFLLCLKKNQNQLKSILANFNEFSRCFDVEYLFRLLSGELEIELGYALSFIASLDVYLHCTPQESNLFITSYQIGTRNVSRKVIDRVVPSLLDILSPYQKVKNL